MARSNRKKARQDVVLEEVVPARRRRWRVYLSLVAALAVLGAFVFGVLHGRQQEVSLERERDRLSDRVEQLEKELRTTRDQLALQRTSTRMAEQAQSKVRDEIRTLRDQVAELEEAVAFYKNVMAPGSREEGLYIEQLDLAPTEKPRVFDFRLVLTQLGDNRAFLSGQVQFEVAGQRPGEAEGESKAVTLGSDVLRQGSETGFRFRYFQELTGRIELPEGVEPNRVTVKAVATGRRRDRAEREFTWELQESDRAWAG
jgi:hypothetical protein